VNILGVATNETIRQHSPYCQQEEGDEWSLFCGKALAVLVARFPTSKTFFVICGFIRSGNNTEFANTLRNALKKLPDPSPSEIVTLLCVGDSGLAKTVVEHLSKKTLSRVRKLLEEMLTHGSDEDSKGALRGIELIKPTVAETKLLLSVMQGERTLDLRIVACRQVLGSHPEEVLDFAMSTLKKTKTKDTEARVALVGLLASFDDDRSFKSIVAALRDSSLDVQLEAIKALGQSTSKEAPVILLDMVQDNHALDTRRIHAIEALKRRKETWTTAAIERAGRSYSGKVRAHAARYLA
jgi:HEAT repeat protein